MVNETDEIKEFKKELDNDNAFAPDFSEEEKKYLFPVFGFPLPDFSPKTKEILKAAIPRVKNFKPATKKDLENQRKRIEELNKQIDLLKQKIKIQLEPYDNGTKTSQN